MQARDTINVNRCGGNKITRHIIKIDFSEKEIPYKEGMLRASGPQWVCSPRLEGCESSWGKLITREEPLAKVRAEFHL